MWHMRRSRMILPHRDNRDNCFHVCLVVSAFLLSLSFIYALVSLNSLTCFLSFSRQNDAESLWNFVKNLILNPKRVKLDQKSEIGHARTCPGGQVLTSKQRKYFYFLRFYTFPFFMTSTYFKTAEIFFLRFYTFPFFNSKFIIFFIKSGVFIIKIIIFLKSKAIIYVLFKIWEVI